MPLPASAGTLLCAQHPVILCEATKNIQHRAYNKARGALLKHWHVVSTVHAASALMSVSRNTTTCVGSMDYVVCSMIYALCAAPRDPLRGNQKHTAHSIQQS